MKPDTDNNLPFWARSSAQVLVTILKLLFLSYMLTETLHFWGWSPVPWSWTHTFKGVWQLILLGWFGGMILKSYLMSFVADALWLRASEKAEDE